MRLLILAAAEHLVFSGQRHATHFFFAIVHVVCILNEMANSGLKRLYFVVIPGLAILSVVLPLVGTSVFLILPVRSRDVELPECKEV